MIHTLKLCVGSFSFAFLILFFCMSWATFWSSVVACCTFGFGTTPTQVNTNIFWIVFPLIWLFVFGGAIRHIWRKGNRDNKIQ